MSKSNETRLLAVRGATRLVRWTMQNLRCELRLATASRIVVQRKQSKLRFTACCLYSLLFTLYRQPLHPDSSATGPWQVMRVVCALSMTVDSGTQNPERRRNAKPGSAASEATRTCSSESGGGGTPAPSQPSTAGVVAAAEAGATGRSLASTRGIQVPE